MLYEAVHIWYYDWFVQTFYDETVGVSVSLNDSYIKVVAGACPGRYHLLQSPSATATPRHAAPRRAYYTIHIFTTRYATDPT